MKKLFYILILAVAIGCGKDDTQDSERVLENETISGTVSYENGSPCCTDIEISIIKVPVDNPVADTLATVVVSENGEYIFDNILPEQEDLYITLNGSWSILSAMDETPDGDELEDGPPGLIWIGVYLDEDEDDDGNNFVLRVQECEQSLVLGRVFSVIGEDTTDMPEEVVVNLYSSDENGNLVDLLDFRSTSGSFTFTVDNNITATLEIDYLGTSLMPVALALIDESPDGDPVAGQEINHLPVYLDSCEVDDQNNIYLFFNANVLSISGSTLLDLDNDLLGDVEVSDQRVELYARGSDNGPDGSLLASFDSDESGYFEFLDFPEGEYVLIFVGNGVYDVVRGYDDDQETGEPNNPSPRLISVDLTIDNPVDENNIFVVTSDTDCNAMPSILPYPALCDTSQICTYDELPVFVVDEMGEPITTAGGIYQLIWTDLVTGQSQPGDWTYHKTNHPIQLEITYPDGCVYTINYHRDCDQDLNGELSLITMTTGFGPTYNYDYGEILWTVDPFEGTVVIEHSIINTVNNPNLVPEGEYPYSIVEVDGNLEMRIHDDPNGWTYDVGIIGENSGFLYLDDDVPADGIGRLFDKN